jgi:hypothetical protein
VAEPMPEFPPRYDFRLEDLRAWHLVEVSCRRCRHRAPVDHELLLRGRTRGFSSSNARCDACAVTPADKHHWHPAAAARLIAVSL